MNFAFILPEECKSNERSCPNANCESEHEPEPRKINIIFQR